MRFTVNKALIVYLPDSALPLRVAGRGAMQCSKCSFKELAHLVKQH